MKPFDFRQLILLRDRARYAGPPTHLFMTNQLKVLKYAHINPTMECENQRIKIQLHVVPSVFFSCVTVDLHCTDIVLLRFFLYRGFVKASFTDLYSDSHQNIISKQLCWYKREVFIVHSRTASLMCNYMLLPRENNIQQQSKKSENVHVQRNLKVFCAYRKSLKTSRPLVQLEIPWFTLQHMI